MTNYGTRSISPQFLILRDHVLGLRYCNPVLLDNVPPLGKSARQFFCITAFLSWPALAQASSFYDWHLLFCTSLPNLGHSKNWSLEATQSQPRRVFCAVNNINYIFLVIGCSNVANVISIYLAENSYCPMSGGLGQGLSSNLPVCPLIQIQGDF